MNRQITPYETKKLFQFCHRHFVYHYDVQVELVDHLASSIEGQWERNETISFEQALKNTFRKFGITGFSKVKVEKEKALRKKYSRLLFKYMMEFYRWPKMLLTLALTLGMFLLFQIVNSISWILVPYFAALILLGFIYYYKIGPKFMKIELVPGKKFMLLEQLKQFQIGAIVLCQFPIHLFNITRHIQTNITENIYLLLSTALLTVSLNIMLYGYFFYIPQKIKEHFMEQFAEFAV